MDDSALLQGEALTKFFGAEMTAQNVAMGSIIAEALYVMRNMLK